ncbi:MAG: HAD family hydrolase [Verrucomicrobiales bacterium]
MPRRALIFDFDGLIVDTEGGIYQAWCELYGSQGQELALSDYVNCVGSTFGIFDPIAELERRVGKVLEWPPLIAAKDRRIRQLHAGLELLSGVRELLTEALNRSVPCAVASSSDARWIRGWLERFGLIPFFGALCSRDDVALVKPAPDLFLCATKALGLPPSDCLVLEDSRNGLLAARAAGCPCIVVPSSVTRGSNFAEAERVLDSLAGMTLEELLQPPETQL